MFLSTGGKSHVSCFYILVIKRQALINLLIDKNRNCGRNLLYASSAKCMNKSTVPIKILTNERKEAIFSINQMLHTEYTSIFYDN